MTNTQAVGLTAAGILLYTVFTKKAAAGTLNFYPASVKNIHFDGATPIMTVGLAAQNTSNQKFVIRSIAGDLYANSYLIGNVANFTTQTVFPNSQSIINLDIRLSLISLVNDIIRAFQMGNFSQVLKFEGYVNVDNYQVPLNIDYKIGM